MAAGPRSVAEEIDAAVATLGLQGRFERVSGSTGRELFARFLDRFTGGVDSRWWWEHFGSPEASRTFDDGHGFRRLKEIVPDPDEELWFVAEDDSLPHYPVYRATARSAEAVIGECFAFEYYLIARNLEWLVCENHHNVVVAVGETVRSRLLALPDS